MADREYEVGVRLKGDGSGLVGETRAGVQSLRELEDQAKRTSNALKEEGEAMRAAKFEGSLSKQILDEQRAAKAALGTETESYTRTLRGMTQESLAATAGKAGLMAAMRSLLGIFGGPTGIIAVLATAALGWTSFGTAATDSAQAAEDAARRSRTAASELQQHVTAKLGAQVNALGTEILDLERKRDAANSADYQAQLQARIDQLRTQQGLFAGAIAHYTPARGEEAPTEAQLQREEAFRARKAAELEDMEAADRLGASQATAAQAIESEKRLTEQRQLATQAMIESARVATEHGEQLVYTWDAAGNRVAVAREQFETLEEQEKKAAEEARALREANERDLTRAYGRAQAEQARESQREWERTADNIEQALVNAFVQGGKSGIEYLQGALRAAIFAPIISPIVRPFAQGMSTIVSGVTSSMFGGQGIGGAMGLGNIMNAGGIAGAGASAGGAISGVALAEEMSALGVAGGGASAGFLGIPGWGWAIGGGLLAASALGLFEDDGPAQRSAPFRQGFGARAGNPYRGDSWFSDAEMRGSLDSYSAQVAMQEQNLIRNLGLNQGQISAVDAALDPLGAKRYDFGTEHTDWLQSGAAQQIQADRLQAISSALGRSIEELTQVMAFSAEQWEQAIDTLREQEQQLSTSLGAAARGLPGQLGISGLENLRTSLAVSEANSPLERVAAARSSYEQTLARANAGDLDAVRAFPQAAQQLLGVGREVYASGGGYQDLFLEVNRSLGDVLERQRTLQDEILADVPSTILEASQDQITELKRGFAAMVAKLDDVQAELRRFNSEAA